MSREKRLKALINAAVAPVIRTFENRPGAVIERLSAEDREALKQLTADDVRSMRVNARDFA